MMYESQVVGNYVIVSPVKDEEKYIETTIKSVIGQTVRPSSWIIVDDGSRDRTSGIVRKYCQRYSWIHFVRIDRGAEKQVGSAEVSAFVLGYKQVEADHEFVVKLDGDLDLPEDYFAGLIARFREDETLGIASGLFLEQKGKRWVLCRLPDYHAVGASKMVRIECYRQIGGFILEPGWDTVDEIRARA